MVIIPKLLLNDDLAGKLAEMADFHDVPLDRMMRFVIRWQYAAFLKAQQSMLEEVLMSRSPQDDGDIPF